MEFELKQDLKQLELQLVQQLELELAYNIVVMGMEHQQIRILNVEQ
jgi:hypothetical protein